MLQSVENFKKAIARYQLGSVSDDMFDHLHVKAYGDSMPFKSVAQTIVRNKNSVIVKVFDSSVSFCC
jgi:ribosome recycling factor